jgi:hypothetical protein
VLEEQRVHGRIDEVVDGGDLHLGGPLDHRAKRLATDPAESVDGDPHGHGWLLFCFAPIRGSGFTVRKRRECATQCP